jgi:hypothetical protein
MGIAFFGLAATLGVGAMTHSGVGIGHQQRDRPRSLRMSQRQAGCAPSVPMAHIPSG